MIGECISASIEGFLAKKVSIEATISSGLPNFQIVGLPEGAVKEAKIRVPAALENAGLKLPTGKITLNLAPADLKKEGNHFDLGIAMALLNASGSVTPDFLKETAFLLHEIINFCDEIVEKKESEFEEPYRPADLFIEESRKKKVIEIFSGLTGYGAIFKVKDRALEIIVDFRLGAFKKQTNY